MKRTPLKKIGKKSKDWQRSRKELIKGLKKTGEYKIEGTKVYGLCKDCFTFKLLTPDHRIKRSQGGKHTKENIEWVCLKCHNERDNQNDPNHKKPKKNRPDWCQEHKCKHCNYLIRSLICSNCKKLSI